MLLTQVVMLSPCCMFNIKVIVFQNFQAPVNQVFPAEDDVNKHVEDNCECHCV